MTDDPAHALDARQLRDATRALVLAFGALDDMRRPCGATLPMPDAWALLTLREADALTVTALSAHLGIDRTNVSRLCARMEARGELVREDHPSDGRARQVRLTDKGRALADHLDASSAAHFAAVRDRLPPDAALDHLLSALGALTDALHTTSAHAEGTS